MSENLDLVRSIYADWERGDFSRADWADPDIEYTAEASGPLSVQTWTGLASMAEGARSIIEVIEDQHIEAEEYRELDDMRVLALNRRSGTWKQSGIGFGTSTALPTVGAHLFHVSNGKVRRLVAYFDRDRALADLGLEEWRCRRSPRRCVTRTCGADSEEPPRGRGLSCRMAQPCELAHSAGAAETMVAL